MIDMILSTSLSQWILSTYWAWPLFETFHFFGLSLLLGALMVIDLRMVGLFRGMSMQATHQLLPLVFIGFGINIFTGILFIFGDPGRYFINIGFQIKMVLVFLAGINAVLFYWKVNGPMHNWDAHGDVPTFAKVIGAASLVLWFGVLVLGRLIPYVGTG